MRPDDRTFRGRHSLVRVRLRGFSACATCAKAITPGSTVLALVTNFAGGTVVHGRHHEHCLQPAKAVA
jgi:hypothetical protein